LDNAFPGGRPGGHSLGHATIALMAQRDEPRQDFGVDLLEAREIETSAADLVRTQFRDEVRIGLEAAHEVEDEGTCPYPTMLEPHIAGLSPVAFRIKAARALASRWRWGSGIAARKSATLALLRCVLFSTIGNGGCEVSAKDRGGGLSSASGRCQPAAGT